jgi:hypothetical protein
MKVQTREARKERWSRDRLWASATRASEQIGVRRCARRDRPQTAWALDGPVTARVVIGMVVAKRDSAHGCLIELAYP